MISISSKSQMLDAFRPIDRPEVQLPHGLEFPVVLKDYMAWVEPSGARVFLLFQDPTVGGARGVVFRRNNATPEQVTQMCQWCHSVRGGNSVRLLTAKLSPKRTGAHRTVGLHLCADLSCKDKVLGTPGINDLREPYSAYQKLFRVLLNMGDFCRNSLGMTLDPSKPSGDSSDDSTPPIH